MVHLLEAFTELLKVHPHVLRAGFCLLGFLMLLYGGILPTSLLLPLQWGPVQGGHICVLAARGCSCCLLILGI